MVWTNFGACFMTFATADSLSCVRSMGSTCDMLQFARYTCSNLQMIVTLIHDPLFPYMYDYYYCETTVSLAIYNNQLPRHLKIYTNYGQNL